MRTSVQTTCLKALHLRCIESIDVKKLKISTIARPGSGAGVLGVAGAGGRGLPLPGDRGGALDRGPARAAVIAQAAAAHRRAAAGGSAAGL